LDQCRQRVDNIAGHSLLALSDVNVFGVLLIPETAIFVYFGDIKRTEVKRLIFSGVEIS